MTWPWIEEFAVIVESGESEHSREEAAVKIRHILIEACNLTSPTTELDGELYRLLSACRIFMRDRRGINELLSAEALDRFLLLVEQANSWSFSVRTEALKCVTNLVYSRPEFVSEIFLAQGFANRLIELTKLEGTASFHWLIWKALLVSLEATEVRQHLRDSFEVWRIIYATLRYTFEHGNHANIIVGARANLLLDLIKLIGVLMSDMPWTEEQGEVLPVIHQVGCVLMDIFRFQHIDISPLNDKLVDLKKSIMEVFIFLPGNILSAFIQLQTTTEHNGADGSLSPILDHLHAMLLIVRVEKTRPLKEILPTLIVCYNLTSSDDRKLLSCFKAAILQDDQPTDTPTNRTKRYFFKHLMFFLTCLDSEVRRYTSEWLFLLCDESGW